MPQLLHNTTPCCCTYVLHLLHCSVLIITYLPMSENQILGPDQCRAEDAQMWWHNPWQMPGIVKCPAYWHWKHCQQRMVIGTCKRCVNLVLSHAVTFQMFTMHKKGRILNDKRSARFEDLITVPIKNAVFCDVTSCSVVGIYRSFGEMYYTVYQGGWGKHMWRSGRGQYILLIHH
jgi:hypothetical protein